jgi:ADP-ribose pyrophosphatase
MSEAYAYEELLAAGRVVHFYRVGVEMPDGSVLPRDLVRLGESVCILPLLDDGRVVLIRNRRHAVGQWLWEVPAGMIDPGEQPDGAARRELREEAGYRAGRLDRLGRIFTAPGAVDERMHVFRATGLDEVGQALEAYEQIEVHRLHLAEVDRMIASGELCDAKTIAAVSLHRAKMTGDGAE